MRILLVLVLLTLHTSLISGQSKKQRLINHRVNQVVLTARSYIGTPYKYGGISESGIDCSGLTTQCFKNTGYQLPRTAKDQSKYGAKVDWNNLQAGDLVFFKFKQKGDSWYHSGIIISIEPTIQFIHASSSRGVVIDNLMKDYYRENVKNFRRIIDGKK